MLQIYTAQTKNLKKLSSARKLLNRSLNKALLAKNDVEISVLTKMLCVTFSCWAEARFVKLLHTPNGFSEHEIINIRTEDGKDRSVEERWKACIETALSKVPASRRTNEKPNTVQRLNMIIEEYVVVPSKLRNKIAHGQWEVALNRENSAENQEFTTEIGALDVIRIELWFDVFEQLAHIVENLIESPDKAHRRDYWYHIACIEDLVEERKSWTVEAKQTNLIAKKAKALKKWEPRLGGSS